MADEKSSKDKKEPDSKKTGNPFGFSLGCLIIIITVCAVIFFLFIKPFLDDSGYSYDDLKEKFFDLKDQARDAVDKTGDAYQDGKEKYEDIKDKTDEHIEDLKKVDDSVREELDKASPKLIED
jgi:uncharacterized protein YjbJ (UPF0337 family)